MNTDLIEEIVLQLQRVMAEDSFNKMNSLNKNIITSIQNALVVNVEKQKGMYGMLEEHKRTFADIYTYFGYERGYGELVIEDMADNPWAIEEGNEIVTWFHSVEDGEVAKDPDEMLDEGDYYSFDIVKVYRTERFTAFITQDEEMRIYYMNIFDNANEYEWVKQEGGEDKLVPKEG
jgi:hypothetical protein